MNRRNFLARAGTAGIGPFMGHRTDAANTGQRDAMPDYVTTGAKMLMESTPAADGFHAPAEWADHECCIMVMPPPQNWKDSGVPHANVLQQWADVANRLSEFEPVLMVIAPPDVRQASKLLNNEIEIVEFRVNDGWSRDSGPVFVTNDRGERRVSGFTFNGWGAKFRPYKDDALLKSHLCAHLNIPMYPVDLVLEGGAIALDGEGTVLTTEQCVLHRNRNPGRNRQTVERLLNDSLGTRKIVWLEKGLQPDPVTDGHVDGLAAFAEPGVVLLHTVDDRSDPNFAICRDAKQRLRNSKDAKGRRLDLSLIHI